VLVLGVFIAEMLNIVSGTDTILYCIRRSLWDGVLCVDYPLWCWVLSVALTSLVYGDYYLGICCHCTIIVVLFLSSLVKVCENYPVLYVCFV